MNIYIYKLIKNYKYIKKINIINGDALKLLDYNLKNQDIILLIDVLEHIKNDKKVMNNIYKILKKDGKLYLSVPTKYYPIFFGKEFVKKVGHVRDGYEINDIISIKNNFHIDEFKYYTNNINSKIFKILYKKNRFIKQFLLYPILKYLIFFLDKFKSKINSSLYVGLSK